MIKMIYRPRLKPSYYRPHGVTLVLFDLNILSYLNSGHTLLSHPTLVIGSSSTAARSPEVT